MARAYEEPGEDEKTAEFYRRARKRFPDDKEVRRESAAFRNGREREYDEDEEDSYSDSDED